MNKSALLFCLLGLFVLPMTTNALTFKKGEVLGPDGKVYSGASPEQQEKLIEKAKNGGDMAGVAHTFPVLVTLRHTASVRLTQAA